jgi:hypothetical protein
MKPIRTSAILCLAATVLTPVASAQAANCPQAGAAPLNVGTVAAVAPGAARTFAVPLGPREGVIVDLISLGGGASGDEEAGQAAARNLRLCDAQGNVLAPQPGDVFAKGGSVMAIQEGERLRFHADAAGTYLVTVAAGEAPREILVRRRDVGTIQAPIVSATLGAPQRGITSSGAPMVFSFAGAAGQWVELKSTSEKDTLLRLAAPDREGAYSVVAENDDSDGLNPVIRRKLPVNGTYFVQVDSLSDEPGAFDLTLARIDAPRPPPPPAALRVGTTVSGRLADGDAVAVYALPVTAGRSYRLDLTAPYDGVVAIGVPNPVEPEDGGARPDSGFAEIKAQDAGTTGTETLGFTARGNGQVLVRVRSFGIGDTDGAFTLKVADLGG